jgi:hypothetical protein
VEELVEQEKQEYLWLLYQKVKYGKLDIFKRKLKKSL